MLILHKEGKRRKALRELRKLRKSVTLDTQVVLGHFWNLGILIEKRITQHAWPSRLRKPGHTPYFVIPGYCNIRFRNLRRAQKFIERVVQ